MLLIDGYNLLFSARRGHIDSRDLETERGRLVRILQHYCRSTGQRAAVVFDHTKGPPVYGEPLRQVIDESIEIRFTTADVSADDEIIGTVAATRDVTAYTVVTSDRAIADAVRRRQVRVIPSAEFADEVARHLAEPVSGDRGRTLSDGEVDYWMKEFGLGQ